MMDAKGSPGVSSNLESLTPREREVLSMIGRGLSLPEIAESLFRSLKTIETHRLSLGRKLGASNRVELARIAIREGLAPLEDNGGGEEQDSAVAVAEQREHVHSQAVETLRAIEKATNSFTGGAYFRRLLLTLAQMLQVRSAMIAEVREGGGIIPIACCDQGRIIDPPAREVDLCPEQKVLETGLSRVDDGAMGHYPNAPLLRRLEAEGYLGVRLSSAVGEPIGVLAVIHDEPLPDDVQMETVLQLTAARAAAELERVRMDERLRQLRENLEQMIEQRTAELRRLNEELSQREQHYRTLVETMTDGLVVIDTKLHITYANRRLCDLIGATAESLVGRLITDLVFPEYAQQLREAQPLRESGNLPPYRLDLRRSDERVPVHVAPRTLFDSQGRYTGSFAVITPIHDVQQTMQSR